MVPTTPESEAPLCPPQHHSKGPQQCGLPTTPVGGGLQLCGPSPTQGGGPQHGPSTTNKRESAPQQWVTPTTPVRRPTMWSLTPSEEAHKWSPTTPGEAHTMRDPQQHSGRRPQTMGPLQHQWRRPQTMYLTTPVGEAQPCENVPFNKGETTKPSIPHNENANHIPQNTRGRYNVSLPTSKRGASQTMCPPQHHSGEAGLQPMVPLYNTSKSTLHNQNLKRGHKPWIPTTPAGSTQPSGSSNNKGKAAYKPSGTTTVGGSL
ncbi:uncharacterized protein LOC121872176 [Homarus americanus]|uniref:uncharacterized protein LOC121872176 n=1 Tax=Homarus americanus TaxID=6706 RepID=UPI001C438BF2|nr:uncharacterized protein LOC121872176 [Homarus americanus]